MLFFLKNSNLKKTYARMLSNILTLKFHHNIIDSLNPIYS